MKVITMHDKCNFFLLNTLNTLFQFLSALLRTKVLYLDIGKESQYHNIQIPEIKSDLLQPRRSLADRISKKGHREAFNQRTLLWNNAHGMKLISAIFVLSQMDFSKKP